ncbi:MAG: DUF4124 domain-containing protein, partial [Xanthomonadales bacterium]|nr:DUF4124 domain-containing protein [Xanthomonadales bacterium]
MFKTGLSRMKARICLESLIVGALLAVTSLCAQAVEVYQWTDENGVVHFSQWAPGDTVEEFETVRVSDGSAPDNGIGISEADDPEGYQAHREEMDALWADIEAKREADRDRQASQPSTQIVYVYDDDEYGYPFFYNGYYKRPPFNRPGRPPMRPRP